MDDFWGDGEFEGMLWVYWVIGRGTWRLGMGGMEMVKVGLCLCVYTYWINYIHIDTPDLRVYTARRAPCSVKFQKQKGILPNQAHTS